MDCRVEDDDDDDEGVNDEEGSDCRFEEDRECRLLFDE